MNWLVLRVLSALWGGAGVQSLCEWGGGGVVKEVSTPHLMESESLSGGGGPIVVCCHGDTESLQQLISQSGKKHSRVIHH